MKKYFFIITTLVFILVSCAPKETTQKSGASLELTIEDLKQYDGTNGNPAYIAIDGKVYDVTDIPMWKDGVHNGFMAGQDLTTEMKEISPHGTSKLKLVEQVGVIVP